MTYTCLTSNQEQTFIQKLSNLYNFYYHQEIHINDMTLSRRHISNIANKIITIVNEDEIRGNHYPSDVRFKRNLDKWKKGSSYFEGAKIQQVLLNILRNGAQAMHEAGTENPKFIIRTMFEKQGEFLIIEIEDNVS